MQDNFTVRVGLKPLAISKGLSQGDVVIDFAVDRQYELPVLAQKRLSSSV